MVDHDRLLVEANRLSLKQYLFPVGSCGIFKQLLSYTCGFPHKWIHSVSSCYLNILLVHGKIV